MAVSGKKKIAVVAVAVLAAAEAAVSVATWPPRADAVEAAKPLLAGAEVDGKVRAIFERSCRDCHGAVAGYPWYAYVAPGSMLVRENVTKGRQYLDLTRWPDLPVIRRQRMLSGIASQMTAGSMPPDDYLQLHPYAKLSEAERTLVFDWSQAERLRMFRDMLPR